MGGRLAPTILTETLGTKLRRLARSAQISNPVINPPFLLPPAYAYSTFFVAGEIVSNGGRWYMTTTQGTTAASGAGPVENNSGQAIADGTALFEWYGAPTITANDALAPTITTVTSSATVAASPYFLTSVWNPSSFPSLFRIRGGYTVSYSGEWGVATFNYASGSAQANCASYECYVTDRKFAVGFYDDDICVQITIDGRPIKVGGIKQASSGAPNWVIVDFGEAFKKRHVVVEYYRQKGAFFGIRTTNRGSVHAAPAIDAVRAVFISDSLFEGSSYGPMLPGGQTQSLVGKLLGWDDCWGFVKGGTGYIATASGTAYTYGQRIAEALTRNPDVWVFAGSTNDIGNSSASITAAALACYQAIRAGGSTAPIIVFGVWPINNASVSTVETAIQAAVTAFADPLGKTFFIPCYGDTMPWVTGAWNNSANTGSVNAPMYIGGDNVHPTEIGTLYYANRIADAIRKSVLPNIR